MQLSVDTAFLLNYHVVYTLKIGVDAAEDTAISSKINNLHYGHNKKNRGLCLRERQGNP